MKSNDIAIKVEKISKCYRIGLKENMHDSFGDAIIGFFKSPLKNYRKYRSLYNFDKLNSSFESKMSSPDLIWALNDVSFEVMKGEVLGIIGENGAGKTTLLKVLSKITDPTFGQAEINGRVSSLLEVGTGFHPELTGRENIYLNGTILGMTKREIDRKFDNIVKFSGVEKFIDTPVKRYSSGMKVRLAFSVAAHLEPEILIVDEVLAVGDVVFQKKCMGKMSEVAREGRTVLLVSHNMGAIANLCTKVLWVNCGEVKLIDDPKATISAYLKSVEIDKSNPDHWQRSGKGEARIVDAQLLDLQQNVCSSFLMGDTLVVKFTIESLRYFNRLDVSVKISKENTGQAILHLLPQDRGLYLNNIEKGKRSYRVEIPNCFLYPGSYNISLWVGSPENVQDDVKNILSFSMSQSDISNRTTPFYEHLGIYYSDSIWKELKH
jgi:lipopolysaccharide transport system ATP-binding protein